MDQYRSELEAARHKIAALEDQLQQQSAEPKGTSRSALILQGEARPEAVVVDLAGFRPAPVVPKDELTQARERVLTHEMQRVALCVLLGSVVVGVAGMLTSAVIGPPLLFLTLLSVPSSAFLIHSRRKARGSTHPLCPLCRKPGIYRQCHQAWAHDLERVLDADDASCDDLAAVPLLSELRGLFHRADKGSAAQQELRSEMLRMLPEMRVCNHRCFDCGADTKPAWNHERPAVLGTDAGIN